MPKGIVYIDEETSDEMHGECLLDNEMVITKDEASELLYAMKNHWIERIEPHYSIMSQLLKKLRELAYD